ncbi:MAG: tetratricopeptide repeat protein [Candidatus Aminicenantes bacterium]|nr:MAG: tetratricopeptide repeat protein [Candidatus Aminicenantes bacterium]
MSHRWNNKILNLGLSILLIIVWIVPITFAQEHMGKGRVNGIVVDDKGQPLEGALILCESLRHKTKLEGHSDKKGNFAVLGLGTGPWKITASKQGYASSSVDMNIRQLRRNPPVTFTLQKMKESQALMSDEESYQLFDQGNLLIKEEKYDEALAVFEEFLIKYPEIYQVHLNIGTCYLKKGEMTKAEESFKLVLDKTLENHGDYKNDPPASLRAFTGLGEIYLRKEDFETSQKYFAQALEISPEDEVAAYNVGEVFFSNLRIDEAIRYFELAVQIKKDWPKPYLKLGYAYLNKGDYNKALEYFNKFVEIDPESPQVPTVKNIIATIEKMKK